MFACFLAVVGDWCTGLAAAYKTGKPITSARMRDGFGKLIGYFGLVLIAIATAQVLKATGVEIPQVPILTAALGLIFATEALSVIENVTKLTGLKIPFLKRVLEGIKPDEEPPQEPKPKKIETRSH